MYENKGWFPSNATHATNAILAIRTLAYVFDATDARKVHTKRHGRSCMRRNSQNERIEAVSTDYRIVSYRDTGHRQTAS